MSDAWNTRTETRSKLGQVVLDSPVQDMLRHLSGTGEGGINQTDEFGWTPLMWACAKGQRSHAEALLAAGADPWRESQSVVFFESRFFSEGMDASTIVTKQANFRPECTRLAHFMFYTLNADQRLLAAYRRLLLAAGLYSHMAASAEGSPLEWLEIEMVTIAGCVPPASMPSIVTQFTDVQGFAWRGPRLRLSVVPAAAAAVSVAPVSVPQRLNTQRRIQPQPQRSSCEPVKQPHQGKDRCIVA
jgi:hypothetical protein